MVQTDIYYWYGLTAAAYIVTCWVFSVVRGVHNCGTPKERRAYINAGNDLSLWHCSVAICIKSTE